MLPIIQTTAIAIFLSVFVSAGTVCFYPNPGCMGPSVQFSGMKPDACCSVSNVYATVKLLDTAEYVLLFQCLARPFCLLIIDSIVVP
jgi:hypothetical protein